jgi:hypothetical protein
MPRHTLAAQMKLRPGSMPFFTAVGLGIAIAVWTRVGDPPVAVAGAMLALIVALLLIAEWRHR